jgi:non-specific serine/threonine protein kinase/serine/threonine-protein kinase
MQLALDTRERWIEPVLPGTPLGPGDRVGRYEIVEQVGEGGMGIVYRAVSREPVHRDVALKLCKAPLDAQEVIRRFEAERQALATMDHPAIATLLDGGTTEAGQPYFVMEFVDGKPLDVYADQQRLTVGERLELFAEICDAVQHAHQNGIIHRDLKPTNMLVTERDGRPHPKVIDFGVAKAMAQPLTERTLFTHFGALIGTPAYMSPEQLKSGAASVDTRSDVYSLGAVLYQLITGAALVDMRCAREAGFDEIRRVICEEEPKSLVERIRAAGNSASELAASRKTDVRGLLRGVQGDLEWIVRRSVAKERNERYSSAAELASDVRRLLAGEPTLAHPPSFGYQLRKLMSRHRVPFTAGGLAAVVALAFLVVLMVQNQRLEKARERAERTSRFLGGMLVWLDPSVIDSATVSLEQVLDEASRRLKDELADAPDVSLDLHAALGEAYLRQGRLGRAIEHAQAALDLARTLHDEPKITSGIANLATATYLAGRPKEARPLAQEAIDRLEREPVRQEQELALMYGLLGEAAYRLGDLRESARRLDQALEIQERHLHASSTPADFDLARRLSTSGAIAWRLGEKQKARTRLERALAVLLTDVGHNEAQRAWTLIELASIDRADGRFDASEHRLEEAISIYATLWGVDSHLTQTARTRQGEAALERFQLARADALLSSALARLEVVRGADKSETIAARGMLAAVHAERNAPDEALRLIAVNAPLFQAQAQEIERRPHGEIRDLLTSASALLALGRAAQAEAAARDALALVQLHVGEQHGLAAQARNSRARALRASGAFDEALREAQLASEIAAATWRDDDLVRAQIELTLGEILLTQDRCEQARPLLETARAVLNPVLVEPSATRERVREIGSLLSRQCLNR